MMKLLYCPVCQNYLLAGDGELHDCCCGWKQPEQTESDDEQTTETGGRDDKV